MYLLQKKILYVLFLPSIENSGDKCKSDLESQGIRFEEFSGHQGGE